MYWKKLFLVGQIFFNLHCRSPTCNTSMIKHQNDNQLESGSAFHPLPGSLEKTFPTGIQLNKRDSGYGTDCSPAHVTGNRRFTYDDGDEECGLSETVFQMDLNKEGPDNVFDEAEETDPDDLEVQRLLNKNSDSQGSSHAVSQPIHFRPLAPGPNPDDEDSRTIASPYFHTQWTPRDRRPARYGFRPIVSRSVGTQTPSPNSQLIRDAVESRRRFQPYARGTVHLRLRSDSEEEFGRQPLPDLVPLSRDRSVSLPDVPSFRRLEHEQYVGRELRRISDEFNSSFVQVQLSRTRTISEQSSSFPRNVNISLYMATTFTQIRRYLSNSPIDQDSSNTGSNNNTPTSGRHH